jgi:hypothetical protein
MTRIASRKKANRFFNVSMILLIVSMIE